jgi:hypothetical protein
MRHRTRSDVSSTPEEPARPTEDEDAERAAELHRELDQASPEGLATTDNPPPGNVTPS